MLYKNLNDEGEARTETAPAPYRLGSFLYPSPFRGVRTTSHIVSLLPERFGSGRQAQTRDFRQFHYIAGSHVKSKYPAKAYFVLDNALALKHNQCMNKLTTSKRAQIISALVEGNSLRATSRMTGASKVTILRLLAEVGMARADYQDKTLRNLRCKRVQCDEV